MSKASSPSSGIIAKFVFVMVSLAIGCDRASENEMSIRDLGGAIQKQQATRKPIDIKSPHQDLIEAILDKNDRVGKVELAGSDFQSKRQKISKSVGKGILTIFNNCPVTQGPDAKSNELVQPMNPLCTVYYLTSNEKQGVLSFMGDGTASFSRSDISGIIFKDVSRSIEKLNGLLGQSNVRVHADWNKPSDEISTLRRFEVLFDRSDKAVWEPMEIAVGQKILRYVEDCKLLEGGSGHQLPAYKPEDRLYSMRFGWDDDFVLYVDVFIDYTWVHDNTEYFAVRRGTSSDFFSAMFENH